MEPRSVIVVSATVGGAAGEFARALAEGGRQWLAERVAGHRPEVQRRAGENASRFLDRLAARVARLEAEVPTAKERIDAALDDPDTSLLLQRVVVSASTTDTDERHEILSELIAQRLMADANDNVALAGGAACDVVTGLSARQIRALGLLSLLRRIHPDGDVKFDTQEQYDGFVVSWWAAQLARFAPLEPMRTIDPQHLLGLSCVYASGGVIHTEPHLGLPQGGSLQPSRAVLVEQPWYEPLLAFWRSGAWSIELTSTGMLIGTLYFDGLAKAKTKLAWD